MNKSKKVNGATPRPKVEPNNVNTGKQLVRVTRQSASHAPNVKSYAFALATTTQGTASLTMRSHVNSNELFTAMRLTYWNFPIVCKIDYANFLSRADIKEALSIMNSDKGGGSPVRSLILNLCRYIIAHSGKNGKEHLSCTHGIAKKEVTDGANVGVMEVEPMMVSYKYGTEKRSACRKCAISAINEVITTKGEFKHEEVNVYGVLHESWDIISHGVLIFILSWYPGIRLDITSKDVGTYLPAHLTSVDTQYQIGIMLFPHVKFSDSDLVSQTGFKASSGTFGNVYHLRLLLILQSLALMPKLLAKGVRSVGAGGLTYNLPKLCYLNTGSIYSFLGVFCLQKGAVIFHQKTLSFMNKFVILKVFLDGSEISQFPGAYEMVRAGMVKYYAYTSYLASLGDTLKREEFPEKMFHLDVKDNGLITPSVLKSDAFLGFLAHGSFKVLGSDVGIVYLGSFTPMMNGSVKEDFEEDYARSNTPY